MPDGLGAVLGTVVLVATVSDLIATAVAPSLHGGWLTRRVGTTLWGGLRRVFRDHRRLLQLAGLGLAISLVAAWISALLLGWTLLLHDVAVLEHTDGHRADWWDTFYYAGYTLSTMGNGDFSAVTWTGQALTVVAAVTGLLALTMAITYLVPVLRAAADRRVLASTISALGTTPAALADTLWPDGRTGQHDAVVLGLARDVRDMVQAHSSYPVLHFFTDRYRRTAVAPNLAALDEALATVVGEDPGTAPPPERLLHDAITALLDALMASFVTADLEKPPPPALADARPDRAERRRQLAAWCHDDGWDWEEAMGPGHRNAGATTK